MEFVGGVDLQFAWNSDLLSKKEKKAVVEEIASSIKQLRSLEPPQAGIVSSPLLKECHDHRIGSDLFGPFNNHAAFHSFLRGHIPLDNCTEVYGEVVTRCHSRQYRSCFTHADLCPRNIVVNGGKVAAIIDWEFGGWYPEYWEYTKTHFGLMNMPGWYEDYEFAVTRYDEELAAERALWRQFDQPGIRRL